MIICNYKLSRYSTYRCIHVRSGTSAGLCRLEVDLFCDWPCPPAYILSSGIGSLGGNGLIDPPCPKGAVDMTDKQLQLHPDPQALVPFTFYYLEVQLMIIINNIELLLNAKSEREPTLVYNSNDTVALATTKQKL